MRISVSKSYHVVLFIWELVVMLSSEISRYTPVFGDFERYAWVLLEAYVIVKILFELNKHNYKDLCLLILLLVVGYFSLKESRSSFLRGAFWILAGSYDVDIDKSVKALFKAQILAALVIITSMLLGLVPNISIVKSGGGVGYSLGYYHPNDFAGCVLQMTMMHFYLIRKKPKLRNSFAYFGIAIIIYIITKSFTVVSLLLVLAFFTLIIALNKNGEEIQILFVHISIKVIRWIAALAGILSILFSFRNDIGVSILGDFHSRITQMGYYFSFYSIKLWGQPLLSHTSEDYDWRTNLYTLDNGYAYLLLGLGLVIFCLFIYLVLKRLFLAVKNKEYAVLIILCVYAIWGFTETFMIRMIYNFSILFFAEIIWHQYGNNSMNNPANFIE